MIGNVWEWCSDWHHIYGTELLKDPAGPKQGDSRVLRGGSWGPLTHDCRPACRSWNTPAFGHSLVGFRVVIDAARE